MATDSCNTTQTTPLLVGLAGLGTVGGGTVTALKRNRNEIARRVGRPIQLYAVASRSISLAKTPLDDETIVFDDIFQLTTDPKIDVVVELIGGCTTALDLVVSAIKEGKHVVTANKELLAKHGNAIFQLAQEKGVMVGFEAAVAGGIPIIKGLREGLSANRIEWVCGIINGTSNYILTAMHQKKACFSETLSDAQQLGYAEADPTSDIEGYDAAYKLTILAAIAFGIPMCLDQCHIEGIRNLSAIDMNYAEELGYKIKFLGLTRRIGNTIELRVHPTLIPINQLLADVDGVMNAVLVNGDIIGQTLHYGPGAGALPTASAVVADLIDIARLMHASPESRVPYVGFQHHCIETMSVVPIDQIFSAYYLRIKVLNRAGVLADITHLLGKEGVSIEALIQKSPLVDEDGAQIIILTNRVQERAMRLAVQAIGKCTTVIDQVVWLRVETLQSSCLLLSINRLQLF